MSHSQEKSNTVLHSLLLRKKEMKLPVNLAKTLSIHLKTAKIVKTPPSLQALFKKSLFKLGSQKNTTKDFSVFQKGKSSTSKSLLKSIEDAESLKNTQTFRLSYLKQLLLEEQISHREYSDFRRQNTASMRRQLQSIGKLIKDHYGEEKLKSRKIKNNSLKAEREPLPSYKDVERDYTLTRITDFNRTS